MIDKILSSNKQLVCMVVKKDIHNPLNQPFVTDPKEPIQVGLLTFQEGDYVLPHYHPERSRVVKDTLEVLVVKRGLFKLTFYMRSGEVIDHRHIGTDDVVILFGGFGHSMDFLSYTEIVECKIGPYLGKEIDKVFIEEK